MTSPDPEVPAISGRRLTRLLARWADTRRLDSRQAEAICLAVRAAPVDLGFDWWWRLLDPADGSAFRAGAMQHAFAGARRPSFAGAPWPAVEPPFGMVAPEPMAWSQEDAEYQPYLRLA